MLDTVWKESSFYVWWFHTTHTARLGGCRYTSLSQPILQMIGDLGDPIWNESKLRFPFFILLFGAYYVWLGFYSWSQWMLRARMSVSTLLWFRRGGEGRKRGIIHLKRRPGPFWATVTTYFSAAIDRLKSRKEHPPPPPMYPDVFEWGAISHSRRGFSSPHPPRTFCFKKEKNSIAQVNLVCVIDFWLLSLQLCKNSATSKTTPWQIVWERRIRIDFLTKLASRNDTPTNNAQMTVKLISATISPSKNIIKEMG